MHSRKTTLGFLIFALVLGFAALSAPGTLPVLPDKPPLPGTNAANGMVDKNAAFTATRDAQLNAFVKWKTAPGLNYTLQSSSALEDGWADVPGAVVYGFGQPVSIRVYDAPPPNPNNPPPVPPLVPGYSFSISRLVSHPGYSLVTWTDAGVEYVAEVQLIFSASQLFWDGEITTASPVYRISFLNNLINYAAGQTPPVTSPLPAAQAVTLGKLTSAYSFIQANPTPTGNSSGAVSTATQTGARRYYRLRVEFVDSDNDGLFDYQELDPADAANNSNPFLADSDGDGANDFIERLRGSNPGNYNSDGDALTDLQEINLGTDPTKNDTDYDNISDSDEVAAGTNPLHFDMPTITLMYGSRDITVTYLPEMPPLPAAQIWNGTSYRNKATLAVSGGAATTLLDVATNTAPDIVNCSSLIEAHRLVSFFDETFPATVAVPRGAPLTATYREWRYKVQSGATTKIQIQGHQTQRTLQLVATAKMPLTWKVDYEIWKHERNLTPVQSGAWLPPTKLGETASFTIQKGATTSNVVALGTTPNLVETAIDNPTSAGGLSERQYILALEFVSNPARPKGTPGTETYDTDGDGLPDNPEKWMGNSIIKTTSRPDGLPDGDAVTPDLFTADSWVMATRGVAYNFNSNEKGTPSDWNQSQLRLVVDRAFKATVTPVTYALGLGTLLQGQMDTNNAFPATAAEATGTGIPTDDDHGPTMHLPEASMGYGAASATSEGTCGHQRKVWMRRGDTDAGDATRTVFRVTSTTSSAGATPTTTVVPVSFAFAGSAATSTAPVTLLAERTGTATIVNEALIVPELYTDLNNDGFVNNVDTGLLGKPYAAGATPADIDKGTEFIFYNDQLSNGAWDIGDTTTPGKPATATDDDAEEIAVHPRLSEGEVWLDYSAIIGLSFYTSRKCLATEKVNLTPAAHFTISSANPFPERLYVRADGTMSFPLGDPQITGDLKLFIKPTGSLSGTEVAKMKLTVVKELNATKYVAAIRDYIRENNATHYYAEPIVMGNKIQHVAVLRQQAGLTGINASLRKARRIHTVVQVWEYPDFIMNCSYVYDNNSDDGFYRLHAGELYNGAWDKTCSVLGSSSKGPAAAWVASKGAYSEPSIDFGTGDIPQGYTQGTGGLTTWDGATTGPDNWVTISDVKLGDEALIFGGVSMGTLAARVFYHDALIKSSTATNVYLCDGGQSVALAVKSPGGTFEIKESAARHTSFYLYSPGAYAIKTYLGFSSSRGRSAK